MTYGIVIGILILALLATLIAVVVEKPAPVESAEPETDSVPVPAPRETAPLPVQTQAPYAGEPPIGEESDAAEAVMVVATEHLIVTEPDEDETSHLLVAEDTLDDPGAWNFDPETGEPIVRGASTDPIAADQSGRGDLLVADTGASSALVEESDVDQIPSDGGMDSGIDVQQTAGPEPDPAEEFAQDGPESTSVIDEQPEGGIVGEPMDNTILVEPEPADQSGYESPDDATNPADAPNVVLDEEHTVATTFETAGDWQSDPLNCEQEYDQQPDIPGDSPLSEQSDAEPAEAYVIDDQVLEDEAPDEDGSTESPEESDSNPGTFRF